MGGGFRHCSFILARQRADRHFIDIFLQFYSAMTRYTRGEEYKTLSMPRPGGNPGLKKFQFKSLYAEPATELFSIRVPPSLNKKLKALGKDKAILVRKALEDLVADLPESL